MSSKSRTILVLIAVQGACVTVGLWMLHLQQTRIYSAKLRECEAGALRQKANTLARLSTRTSGKSKVGEIVESAGQDTPIHRRRTLIADECLADGCSVDTGAPIGAPAGLTRRDESEDRKQK